MKLGRAQLRALQWFAQGNEAEQNLIRGLRFQREAPRREVMHSLARLGLVRIVSGVSTTTVSATDEGRAEAERQGLV